MSAFINSVPHTFLLLLLVAPLLSALVILMAPQQFKNQASTLSIFFHALGTVLAFILFFQLWNNDILYLKYPWFGIEAFQFDISLLFNNLSALLSLLVMSIGTLVNIYSVAYMQKEAGQKRYFGMLSLFTFAMLLIVLSGNLLFMFIGWELVGFASYMLIGYWREKPAAAKAASKAFIMNRIGDAGFLIALLIAWSQAGTFDLIALQNFAFDSTWHSAIGLFIFIGVLGKSAQFPLITWLPDAMEGPTPVSALIHAATMVAAGIFLLARVNFLLDATALHIITVVGSITALMAALAAWQQNDIKKILAYSTISQLGLMVIAIGQGSYAIAIFHLFTHAFFKAALFLSAGNIIYATKHAAEKLSLVIDPQNTNNMGALRKYLPVSFISFTLSAASLAGLPLFSGFLSKEAIFILALNNENYFLLVLLFVISLLTVLYISKGIFKIFFSANTVEESHPGFLKAYKEPSYLMRLPALLLALASVWWVVGLHPFDYAQWLVNDLSPSDMPASTLLSVTIVIWIGLAVLLSYYLYSKKTESNIVVNQVLKNNFYLDVIYYAIVIQPSLALTSLVDFIDRRVIDKILHGLAYVQVALSELTGWFDRNIIDGTVNFGAFVSTQTGILIRTAGAGKIQSYIALSMLLVVVFLLWIMFKQL